GSTGALLEDATAAAVDALVARAGGPAWDEEGFVALRERVAAGLPKATARVVTQVVRILDIARSVREALADLIAAPLQPGRQDVDAQLRRLLPDGFITSTGAGRLADLERYVTAALRRVGRLSDAVATDADRMRTVRELEQAHAARLASWPSGRPLPDVLTEVPGSSRSCASASSPRDWACAASSRPSASAGCWPRPARRDGEYFAQTWRTASPPR
ncbi:MAG: DUF3418 domain-containing protein, partial [Actinomycetota bacterium]|nr:DUF3418 domain-containing protein [Actinomycetota bacterium]